FFVEPGRLCESIHPSKSIGLPLALVVPLLYKPRVGILVSFLQIDHLLIVVQVDFAAPAIQVLLCPVQVAVVMLNGRIVGPEECLRGVFLQEKVELPGEYKREENRQQCQPREHKVPRYDHDSPPQVSAERALARSKVVAEQAKVMDWIIAG